MVTPEIATKYFSQKTGHPVQSGAAHLYGFLIGVASSILFGRLALFTLKNAVNILYWDQWDFTLHHNRSRSVN